MSNNLKEIKLTKTITVVVINPDVGGHKEVETVAITAEATVWRGHQDSKWNMKAAEDNYNEAIHVVDSILYCELVKLGKLPEDAKEQARRATYNQSNRYGV